MRTLDLDVNAIGSNGSKLMLHELGAVDPVTGMLDPMRILSAEMVIFNP